MSYLQAPCSAFTPPVSTNIKNSKLCKNYRRAAGEDHEIHHGNAEVRGTSRGGFASRGSGTQVRCSAHPQPARNAKKERRGLSQCLSDPRNMQPSKGQRSSDRGHGPEYGVAMPCLRLFRGQQDKDRHDEAIRDAESAFRFPSLGPRSARGGGGDHRNDRRSQVALSLGMVIRAREPRGTQTATPEALEMSRSRSRR